MLVTYWPEALEGAKALIVNGMWKATFDAPRIRFAIALWDEERAIRHEGNTCTAVGGKRLANTKRIRDDTKHLEIGWPSWIVRNTRNLACG